MTQDATEHRKWSELDPVRQAGMRCKEPVFWAFLWEYGFTTKKIEDKEAAAVAVRAICQIESRRDLGTDPSAQATWHSIENLFAAWKGRDR